MTRMAEEYVHIEVVGVIRSCFSEKFGIPRQPGLAPSAVATLDLREPFNRQEMVRGLEGFSHIWLQFIFHQAIRDGWKPTVRPPRLGGRHRRGVFATRSPHRPNHLGLSVVRLLGVGQGEKGVRLDLGGVDLLDGTPVIDIKPYIPYSDRLENVLADWAESDGTDVMVQFLPETEAFCREYETTTGRKLSPLIYEVLAQDPRPASQRRLQKEFGMLLWDVNVRWIFNEGICTVTDCVRVPSG